MYKISILDWGNSVYRLWMYCDESEYLDRIVFRSINDVNFVNSIQALTGVPTDDTLLELTEEEYNDIYTLFEAFIDGSYKKLILEFYKDPTYDNLQKLKVKMITKELFALEFHENTSSIILVWIWKNCWYESIRRR